MLHFCHAEPDILGLPIYDFDWHGRDSLDDISRWSSQTEEPEKCLGGGRRFFGQNSAEGGIRTHESRRDTGFSKPNGPSRIRASALTSPKAFVFSLNPIRFVPFSGLPFCNHRSTSNLL